MALSGAGEPLNRCLPMDSPHGCWRPGAGVESPIPFESQEPCAKTPVVEAGPWLFWECTGPSASGHCPDKRWRSAALVRLLLDQNLDVVEDHWPGLFGDSFQLLRRKVALCDC